MKVFTRFHLLHLSVNPMTMTTLNFLPVLITRKHIFKLLLAMVWPGIVKSFIRRLHLVYQVLLGKKLYPLTQAMLMVQQISLLTVQ